VTTNGYSLAYVGMGMILSWVFYFMGDHVGPIPHIKSATPVIFDALGVFAAYVGPIIGFRTKPTPDVEQPGYLPFPSSRNILYDFLEEGVQNCIRKQMHRKIITASRLYGWDSIKLAATQALAIEMNFSQLTNKVYTSECKFVESLPTTAKSANDSNAKYGALTRVLRHCDYRHLLFHLREANKGDL
jgi:hypothetical protein